MASLRGHAILVILLLRVFRYRCTVRDKETGTANLGHEKPAHISLWAFLG